VSRDRLHCDPICFSEVCIQCVERLLPWLPAPCFPPDATLTLKGGSIAAGIGYTWGDGELEYRDSSRRFSIKGVSVVDVGASDFSGNYVAAGAGLAIAGGGTAVYLKNEHGVIVKLIATDVGLKFTLSAEGVNVAPQK
jgi:hypothetical protein